MLVAEFLASDEAEDLSDRQAASRCTDHIVEYGCDRDFGRPLRVSPAKAETFLLEWLPRKVVLSKADQEAMPHVLLAWVRWAGPKSGLSDVAVAATLDAVFESMRTFPNVYRDPASFGLEPDMVTRLLPDGDLEALARRVFAFPLLRGSYRGTDLATLDPASRPTGAPCWPPITTTPTACTSAASGKRRVSTSTGTSRSPTGCGTATRPSSGRPPSGCLTWARTGTRYCTS